MLTGKNVSLRAVRRSDLPFFLKWYNDTEVLQYLIFYLPVTEMAREQWLEGLPDMRDRVDFIIEVTEDNSAKPIGHCTLHDISAKDQNADLGIAIGEKDYWGKGYGTEAIQLLVNYGFKELNLHRISSRILEHNERSLRMHKKLGFREEGCRRKARFKNGQFRHEIILGILREEWG